MRNLFIILIISIFLCACSLFKDPSDLYVGTYQGMEIHRGLILFPMSGTSQIIDDTSFSEVLQLNKIDEKTLEVVGSGELVTAKRNGISKKYMRTGTGPNIQADTSYQFDANRADKDSLYAYETYVIFQIDITTTDTFYKSYLTTEWHVKK